MQNIVKKPLSLFTPVLFHWMLFFLLSFFSSNSFARDKIDEQTIKKLQEAVLDIQFQIKESMAEISEFQQILRPLSLNINNHSKIISKSKDNIKVIDSTLTNVNEQLIDVHKRLDSGDADIKSNKKVIDELNNKIIIKAREIRANTSNLISQKTLIEDNSIRLYEILIQSDNLKNDIKKIGQLLKEIENVDFKEELKSEIYISINQLWHLLATILVFFASLAFLLSNRRDHFKLLEDGVEQHQSVVLVILAVFLGFFTLGFGLMYGNTNEGWIGISHYLISVPETASSLESGILLTEFVLYQIGFVMLAAMIVYTAVGRQLSSLKHLLLALFVATVLIPTFGHWAWAGHFMVDNKGWLESSGFIDQGGAVVVNTVSALFALFIVIELAKSHPPPTDIAEEDNDPTYSSGAVLLLWLGWLGFTTGNLSIADEQITRVMLDVGLAGSAGGLMAYLHCNFFYRQKNCIAQGLGGFVTGLVAIAACVQNVTHLEAIVIGASAGLLQNIGYRFLLQYVLHLQWQRRSASLVAIHGIGGIWGALCVGLFMTDGNFSSPDMNQLMTQFTGVGVAIVYSFLMTKVVLFVLKPSKKSQKIAL